MKCPVSKHRCSSFIDPSSDIHYYHCDACQLTFKSPVYYQAFDVQKRRYDLHQNSEESEGYRTYFQRFLNFVMTDMVDVKRALDFGCGASTLLASMLEEGGIACDSYDPVYNPDNSYRGKYYDLIVSVEVFEHLHHPREIFVHLLSRLKEGGYLAIQTEFHSNDREQFLRWYYRLDPTHIMFYRPDTFRFLCDRHACSYLTDNGKNILVIQK